MIRIDHVRMSFRNYKGSEASARRVATLTMERLEQMAAAEHHLQHASRIVDRAECEPVRVARLSGDEQAISESTAGQVLRTILRHL